MRFFCKNKKNTQAEAGFSLIELSIFLSILSVFVVLSLTETSITEPMEKQAEAINDLKEIKAAVDNYLSENGYFPCPADPSLNAGDSSFGIGVRNPTSGHCEASNLDTTDVDSGIIIAIELKEYDIAGYDPIEKEILFGAVPCVELGLQDDCMLDPYGHKYTYGVMGIKTLSNQCNRFVTSSASRENIMPSSETVDGSVSDAIDDSNFVVVTDTNVADTPSYVNDTIHSYENGPDYVVVYHGEDGIGAYSGSSASKISGTIGAVDLDNELQEMNHHISGSTYGVDKFVLVPDVPINVSDAEYTSAQKNLIFGDIVIWGDNSGYEMLNCIKCREVMEVVDGLDRYYLKDSDSASGDGFVAVNNDDFNLTTIQSTAVCGCATNADCAAGETCDLVTGGSVPDFNVCTKCSAGAGLCTMPLTM